MFDIMAVTLEQQKVVSHPLRSEIIGLLANQAMTAKQVARRLEKTTGSIHYHIKLLFTHGILDIHHTNSINGIVEKYYYAKAAQFYLNTTRSSFHPIQTVHSVALTAKELETLNQEIGDLLAKYGSHVKSTNPARRNEHEIRISIEQRPIRNMPS